MFYISISLNLILLLFILIHLIKKRFTPKMDISNRFAQLDSIEREVKELNSIFTMPYLRGEAGETLLKELLKNYLPRDSYQFQHGFKNGSRVDAIIKTGKYIVPIDSKFPIQSVEELLLSDKPISNQISKIFIKHGEDIAKKYINPTEGTLNFGVMYIPSERLYYRAFVDGNGELTSKLLSLGILPSSPSTLFSFIQTVVYGLKGFTFNQKQGEIMEKIEALRFNYGKLKKQFDTSNIHLKNLNQSLMQCSNLIDDGESLIP